MCCFPATLLLPVCVLVQGKWWEELHSHRKDRKERERKSPLTAGTAALKWSHSTWTSCCMREAAWHDSVSQTKGNSCDPGINSLMKGKTGSPFNKKKTSIKKWKEKIKSSRQDSGLLSRTGGLNQEEKHEHQMEERVVLSYFQTFCLPPFSFSHFTNHLANYLPWNMP